MSMSIMSTLFIFGASRALIAPAVLAACLLSGVPAGAQPIFPPGSRIGLEPPAGMTPSRNFRGFADDARQAFIVINEVGPQALSAVEQEFSAQTLQAGGIETERREDVTFGGARGFLVVARQNLAGVPVRKWALVLATGDLTAIILVVMPEAARQAYPDAALHAALASFAVRETVSDAEKLALLPYGFGDLAGFRLLQGHPDGTALLTYGPRDTAIAAEQPFLSVRTPADEVPPPAGRDSFARRLLAAMDWRDLRIVSASAQKFRGEQGHEIIAEMKDSKNGAELAAVQWLRFGSVGYLQILGIARRDTWDAVLPRMRVVRDRIAIK